MSRFVKLLAAVVACLCAAQAPAAGVVNDFETDGSGSPFVGIGDFFAFDEYADEGVLILDSDPSVATSDVNLSHPANDGAFVQGYYVNVGAFASEGPTRLTLLFKPLSVSEVAFSFASPSGTLNVRAFAAGGGLLFDQAFNAADPFTLGSGAPAFEGSVDISGVGNIALVDIRPQPDEVLIVDNLSYAPVPVPAALPLLTGALLIVGGMRRRAA